jgi:membrane protease YdiL (CAAX protease family)
MTTGTPKQNTKLAAIDILLVIAASVLAGALEQYIVSLGLWPWEGAQGLTGVVAGVATAIYLIYRRGGKLKDIGLKRPERWATAPFWVVGILVVFFGAQILLPQVLSLFMDYPAPDMSKYEAIRGNLAGAIAMALILPLTASIPEEIIYRGFLMDRLGWIFGHERFGAIAAVLGQAVVFSLAHLQWGIGGIILTLMMGVIWGTAYILCGRNLWIVIIAHSVGHVLWVAQLYAGF